MRETARKHALPPRLATQDTAEYCRLVPPDGPWMNGVWEIAPHAGEMRRGAMTACQVSSCDRVVHNVTAHLCHAHAWQWYRAGRPHPVVDWLPTARQPLTRQTERPVIDFRPVPDLVALEVRYVVGTKIVTGDWTPTKALRQVIVALLRAVEIEGVTSLFDRRPEEWIALACESGKHLAGIRAYLSTFFSTLHRTAAADPWTDDHWLWRHGFELVLGNPDDRYNPNIHWDRVTQPWLRDGVKALARRRLVTQARSWNTILTWARAFGHLSAYLDAEGIDEPALVDRDLFLDYLEATLNGGASKNLLMGVNTAASVLADLRQEGDIPDLGSEVFLRYGENSVNKAASPRPFPADVVERIDAMLDGDQDLDEVVRVMLKFNRWGGLRISELVALPLDCLRINHTGGVWVEYYMTKVSDWRRFPLPDALAQLLRDQQQLVRHLYGGDAKFMFPSLNRSSRLSETIRPWSTSGLRSHTHKAFARNGITESAITGERISGASIHRFRHAIATALLNSNWTQTEVQEFLAHKSQTMTQHYAAITDDTLNRKAREFYELQSIDTSRTTSTPHSDPAVERMRVRFTAVLPDGKCMLPPPQSCDYQKNPCKTCSFYDPDEENFGATHANHRLMLELTVIEHKGDAARLAINQANLDALNHRVPATS